MGQRIIYLTTILLLFLNMLSCSDKKAIYKIEDNHLIINKDLKINLNEKIDDLLKKIGGEYKSDSIPGSTVYIFEQYALTLFHNLSLKKVDLFLLNFYKFENNEVILIDEIILSGIKISKKTSFDEMKKTLDSNGIQYNIKESSNSFQILIDNHKLRAIEYVKDFLNCPINVHITVK